MIEAAPGWVTFGYIISRVDAGNNQTKKDLRDIVADPMIQIVMTPGQGRGKKAKWAHINNVRHELASDIVNRRTRRTVSKESHPNRCMAWLPAEVQQLINEVRDGATLAEMAVAHGRTEKAIENRLYRLSKAGSIAWGTRTGTPLQAARPATDYDKSGETITSEEPPSLGSTPKPPMSFGAQAARHEALHTCVGAFLKGKVTLDGLRNAYNAVTESKGDA